MNKVNLISPLLPDKEKYFQLIDEIWENGQLTNFGPLHERFKEKLIYFEENSNVTLHTNGHLALENILKSFCPNGGEVITTPFTFISTTHAIKNCGLKPIFVDVSLEDFNIDVQKIEKHINENTVAILAVHVFGIPCKVKILEQIAQKHNIKLIFDAAHAFGVRVDDKPISSFGDASMYSFHATKVFNTIEGGLSVFSDSKVAQKSKIISNFGIDSVDSISMVGNNSKFNEFQAAMGLCNLEDIEAAIESREKVFQEYNKVFKKISAIQVISELANVKHNYSYYPILIKENTAFSRDEFHEYLIREGIGCRKYFNPLISDLEIYKGSHQSKLTNAEYICNNILVIPLTHVMTEENIQYVCQKVEEYFNE